MSGTRAWCGGDCPNRRVLTHFAGIPQVGVQPGAKPPKFGTYPCYPPAPRPPQTVPRHPPPVAIGVRTSACPLCPDGPGMRSGVLSPMGAKCHLYPLPWTRWGQFSPSCVTQGLKLLWVLRWVLGTLSMGARATPASWAVAGSAPSWGCQAVGGQVLMVSLWQVFLGLESQGLVASQVSAGRS